MKLTVFQSDKGDCLLVSNEHGGKRFNILVDGGMKESYTHHVSPTLGQLRDRGERLNLVYVSHIDQDHISGVLQLFEDMKDWRVHEFQKANGNANHKEPQSVRPPEVDAIWHNAFHEQVKDNVGEIEDMLAASAAILSGSEDALILELAAEYRDLVTSKSEAIQLSRRIGAKQLKVPLNPEFDRALMCIKDGMPSPIKLGGMKLFVIGPSTEDLDVLRKEWNAWLKESQKQLRNLQRRAREDEKDLIGTEASRLRDLARDQAEELGQQISARATAEAARPRKKLGKRKAVTAPNLASLMVLVEAKGKTLLLTGDGHSDDILKGLKHHKKLKQNDGKNLHVSVLKVQHHGSENNLDEAFCRAITADHYIFCGNGEHENPDLDVVAAILESRLGEGEARSPNAEAGNPFTLWFNSSESETADPKAKAHMKKLRKLIEEKREGNKDHFEARFLKGESFLEIEL